ncbi:MAG: tetratricopeptide repeat protein [Pseudomonadota bacterium]
MGSALPPAVLVVALALFAAPSAAAENRVSPSAHAWRDDATILKDWTALAEQGNAIAQLRVGEMLRDGRGSWRLFDDAASWFRLAAAQGNVDAQYALVRLHYQGFIIPRDTAEMMRWLTKLADGGHARAQITLGAVYEYGLDDVQPNLAEALKWYELAAALGGDEVRARADQVSARIRAKMTETEIAEARSLAQAWQPRLQ